MMLSRNMQYTKSLILFHNWKRGITETNFEVNVKFQIELIAI